MWTPQYDIIVETLTGSEFEVTVTDKDTIGYIKSRIQKYEGIPVGQQHLLYNHKELKDATEMKDIPLRSGSRLKLVLDMKGGPVSARRVINLPDCDNWFDISDVLNTTRHDPLTISTPAIKFLVCKDKKSFHRIMKFRSDRKNYGATKTNETPSSTSDNQDDQWVKDNLQTLEKMHELRSKLDLKKKLKGNNSKLAKVPSVLVESDTISPQEKLDRNREVQLSSIDRQTEVNPHGPVVKPKPTKKVDCSLHEATSAEYQTTIISQLMQSDRIGNLCDNFIEEEKKSCGAVNKFGLNKTINPIAHRLPPPLPQTKSKYEKLFQMHAPSPPLLSYNLLGKTSDSNDTHGKLLAHSSNLLKSSFGNLAINRPKRKSTNNCYEEARSKLRENIRRNRSFKTINTNNSSSDEIINRPLTTNNSITSILDHLFASSYNRGGGVEKRSASKSVQDLVEKLSSSKFASYKQQSDAGTPPMVASADLSSKAVGIEHEREMRLPKRANCLNTSPVSNGFENKLFIDRQQTIGLNSVDSSGCASDFKLENGGSTTNSALDGSFRLYKMSAEVKSKYELPKLLIREDSPVESFHSSDPQLETLTIRGESPKNVLDSYPKLTTTGSAVDSAACDREPKTSNSIIETPWNPRHHSDLSLNNLELNFLNEEFTDLETDRTSTMTTTDNCLQTSGGPFLKIASNLDINNSSWNAAAELGDRQSQPSATSLNFINGDLTSSDDEEDVFNSSCCTLHSDSKSKSIELNEFRMMFGSSPTLLNTNYNPVTHTSRLDAVPIQYRRGYSNLNDACLSSSTSDLELFNGVRKKNSSKSASQELPSSFSRHRTTNGSLDFVRSYENLDRTKILRMKNERHRNAIGNCFPDLKPFWDNTSGNEKREGTAVRNQLSRERLQEESNCDEPYSFSNLTYDDLIRGCMDNTSARSLNKCLPIGYPSDESIFNMNLDRFTDDFNLLSMSDRLSSMSANNSRDASRSSLILSELEIDNNSVAVKKPLSPSTSVIIKPTKIPISATGNGTAIAAQKSSHPTSAVIVKPTKIPISAITVSQSLPTSNTALSTTATMTFVSITDTTPAKKCAPGGKLRCAECNKKLGLIMVMKCHCEKVFCPQHRYAEAHNCSYNFKSEGKKILTRENPLVVAQKLPKI